jgi:hypothetical protein
MVTFDVAVALVGAVSLIIPIVNMVSVSVPKESVAVGLGVNTMLRNIGGAIGPVLATSIMTTYTSPLIITIQGHTVVGPQLANSTAFNTIFIIGIALTIVVMAISLGTKNYIFRKQTPK